MNSIRTFICLAILLAPASLPAGAAASPPLNDDFDHAQELTGLPAEATGSNVDATREPGEPNHGHSYSERSIWFKWTAPRDVGVTFRPNGCAPPFKEENYGSTASVYEQTARFGLVGVGPTFRAVAGQTYFIAVATPRGTQPDPDICVRLLAGPPNDDFAAATTLSGFPSSASQPMRDDAGTSTREPGEPTHEGGDAPHGPPTSTESVWFKWTAPADGPVRVRLCGNGVVGVYTGDRVDALTRLATRHSTDRRCGSFGGGSVMLGARAGQTYHLAVTSSGGFEIFVENQVTLAFRDDTPFFLYTAFPGQADDVKLRLEGAGSERALLLRAAGVGAANGCQAGNSPGWLRCPVPGRATIGLDVDLRDGDDRADVRLPGRGRAWEDDSSATPFRRIAGGAGNDTLTGSAGYYSLDQGWTDRLFLLGEEGADRLRGAGGHDSLVGGPGPDRIAGGSGIDRLDGGRGADELVGVDSASDTVVCGAGRDRARMDGFDLHSRCERPHRSAPARAVATEADFSNGDGHDVEHLRITVACPIDAKPGCRARVTAQVGAERTSRRIRLAAGRTGSVEDYSLSDSSMHRSVHRGIRVTVTTRGRAGRRLTFTRHVPVSDVRYTGE